MTIDDGQVYDSLGILKSINLVRNSYKARQKTNEQAKHFDALLQEIEDRIAHHPWVLKSEGLKPTDTWR